MSIENSEVFPGLAAEAGIKVLEACREVVVVDSGRSGGQ